MKKCPFCRTENKEWKTRHAIQVTEKVGAASVQVADYYVTPPPKKVTETTATETPKVEEVDPEKGKSRIFAEFS